MNVPLKWVAEHVKIPGDIKVLTDKLTAVGHMLDKTFVKDGETVIDLELRGNRADMFGLIGVAREVAVIANSALKMPPTSALPKVDKNTSLVNVQPSAKDLVTRYTALKLAVKVGSSPQWLVKRLAAYGIGSINNVVDITNYVMVETGEPLHAFDYHQIKGGQLILRRAKKGEKFSTIAQGQVLTLSEEDLVITDQIGPQALTMIGGLNSKVTENTTQIILEGAVYNQANSRRTARRLKVVTDSGTRHEKNLDPAQVPLALSRAIYLLQQLAEGKVTSLTSDYYPHPVKPQVINLEISEVARLTGLVVSLPNITHILNKLEFTTKKLGPKTIAVTVPTFRTDIEGPADIVEEIIRIHGYDLIPSTPITDATPLPDTYVSFKTSEKLRDVATHLGLNEVVTLTMVDQGEIKLVNPPDPDASYLRSSIYPSLVNYANRLLNLRQNQVAIFEIGKVFSQVGNKYSEHLRLSITMAGKNVTIHNLTGVLQKATALLGVDNLPVEVGQSNQVFWAEIDVDTLMPSLPDYANPYSTISQYPPLIEDVNVTYTGNYQELTTKIKKLSGLITDIELIDNYDNKLTLRLTFHSPDRQLSSSDITSIRQQLQTLV